MKIYCNGDLIDKETLNELFEPGFLFGWGVFEPLRLYGENIAFLDKHIRRFNESLELMGLDTVGIDFEKTIRDVIFANKLKDAYVRITAYKKRTGTGLIIYADSFSYYKDDLYEKGFRTVISSYQRNSNDVVSSVKSLSYLQNRLCWFEAQKKQKDEALVLNEKGFIVGGSRSNLFMVEDKCLIGCRGAFNGITRMAVLAIASKNGFGFKEQDITIEALFDCNEAFLTSALIEIMPLVECEGKKLGTGKPGRLTLDILSEYRKICRNPQLL